MKENIKVEVIKHANNLNKVFGLALSTDEAKLNLCRALRRLEVEAHGLAELECNGSGLTEQEELNKEAELLLKVNKLLNNEGLRVPVFFNGDPRGYALKVSDKYFRTNDLDLHKDWGGYGIIAPDLS